MNFLMNFNTKYPEINEINQEAINTFIENSNETILKVGKDWQGRKLVQVQNKNLWSWIATKLFSNYKLETVTQYIKSNRDDIDENFSNDDLSIFYGLMNAKIKKYNDHRPYIPIQNFDFIEKVNAFATDVFLAQSLSEADEPKEDIRGELVQGNISQEPLSPASELFIDDDQEDEKGNQTSLAEDSNKAEEEGAEEEKRKPKKPKKPRKRRKLKKRKRRIESKK